MSTFFKKYNFIFSEKYNSKEHVYVISLKLSMCSQNFLVVVVECHNLQIFTAIQKFYNCVKLETLRSKCRSFSCSF